MFNELQLDSCIRFRDIRRASSLRRIMRWRQKLLDLLASLRGRPALDALLAHARPDVPLAERVAWAEDLLAWVRRDVPATRLRLLLQLLERQPEAFKRVAQTLRSIVRDTEALDLFADTGLPQGSGFTREPSPPAPLPRVQGRGEQDASGALPCRISFARPAANASKGMNAPDVARRRRSRSPNTRSKQR